MGQIVSKAMIRPSSGLAIVVLWILAAACSSSSSQSGGGWPDSSVGGGDGASEAGDDVGTADAPASDSSGQTCSCGAAFTTCPASRPCVTGVATSPSCAGQVCCGPASDCDGGLDAGDSGRRDAAQDAAHDAPHDAGRG
jgi:hypothetical protein